MDLVREYPFISNMAKIRRHIIFGLFHDVVYHFRLESFAPVGLNLYDCVRVNAFPPL